jgi:hypothetical protein
VRSLNGRSARDRSRSVAVSRIDDDDRKSADTVEAPDFTEQRISRHLVLNGLNGLRITNDGRRENPTPVVLVAWRYLSQGAFRTRDV